MESNLQAAHQYQPQPSASLRDPQPVPYYPLFKQVKLEQPEPAPEHPPQATNQVDPSPKQGAEVVLIEHTPPPRPDVQKQPNDPTAATDAEGRPKLHHLTRHWLGPEARGGTAVEALGCATTKAAEVLIKGMTQRELRAAFQKVYGSHTSSYNNNWLRRKLFEAVGVTGGSSKKTKRVGRDAAARRKEQRRAAAAVAEAEAIEALAEIAAGPSMASADVAESSSE